MKNLLTFLLVLSNLVTPAYANQAVDLKQGQPAPYPGTLLDSEKANNVKNELIEKDADEATIQSLNRSALLYRSNESIYQDENELLLKHNSELTNELNSTKTLSNWEKVGFFLLGVAITGLAIHEAGKLR